MMGCHKEHFLHLIRYTKKLLKLNLFDKKAIAQLAAAIQTEEVLTEKSLVIGATKKMENGELKIENGEFSILHFQFSINYISSAKACGLF